MPADFNEVTSFRLLISLNLSANIESLLYAQTIACNIKLIMSGSPTLTKLQVMLHKKRRFILELHINPSGESRDFINICTPTNADISELLHKHIMCCSALKVILYTQRWNLLFWRWKLNFLPCGTLAK